MKALLIPILCLACTLGGCQVSVRTSARIATYAGLTFADATAEEAQEVEDIAAEVKVLIDEGVDPDTIRAIIVDLVAEAFEDDPRFAFIVGEVVAILFEQIQFDLLIPDEYRQALVAMLEGMEEGAALYGEVVD